MKRFLFLRLVLFFLAGSWNIASAAPNYGSNAIAGKTVEINGIRLYYETYGNGDPLLLIHPNGGRISDMSAQIKAFSAHYRVIIADSRGHGRSELGADHLTYTQMADDYDKLLDSMDVKSANVVGWSDGGIIGLLLAIDYPQRVNKLAIMGANLNPNGLKDWAINWVGREEEKVTQMASESTARPELLNTLEQLDLVSKQPDIQADDLKRIKSPVLVMAGDRDIIKIEHTLKIFENIPEAQLEIVAGATHNIPSDDPARFNRTVAEFLEKPFKRPDTRDMFR